MCHVHLIHLTFQVFHIDFFGVQDEDFLEGLCPWIEGDDRTKKIFAIIKKCYKDPNAFSANKGEPLKGIYDINHPLNPSR